MTVIAGAKRAATRQAVYHPASFDAAAGGVRAEAGPSTDAGDVITFAGFDGVEDDPEAEAERLLSLTRSELIDIAQAKGLAVPGRATKQQIVEMLVER